MWKRLRAEFEAQRRLINCNAHDETTQRQNWQATCGLCDAGLDLFDHLKTMAIDNAEDILDLP